MSTFIYCGYPELSAAEFVINMSEKGIIPKPSGGFISLQYALENFPDTYTIAEIELVDDPQIDEYYADSCSEKWKIYRQSDILSVSIYERTEG